MSRVLNILLKITQTPHVKTFVELERGDVFLENFIPFVVVGVSDRYVIYSRYDKYGIFSFRPWSTTVRSASKPPADA